MSNMIYLAIVSDPNISEEQRKKEKEYKKYVDEHINNVRKIWEEMRNNKYILDYFKEQSDSNLDWVLSTVDNLIYAHDTSKYGIVEWEAYRKNFYPVDEEEKESNRALFEKAWEHHYMNNLHHWDYWHATNSEDKMPLEFVIEMCCDWAAMSMKFGGNAYNWYKSQTDIVLGEKQQKWVVDILKLFYGFE